MPETELSPIASHLFRALEKIRALPVKELEREKLYTNVYQLVCCALDLIVTDEMRGAKEPKKDPKLQESLKVDFDHLFGGS
jgi:hypothetical protein